MTAYRLKGAEGPWGEDSTVLIHGIASLYERGMNGELLLERMGPFIPPMTFPSRLGPVVSDALKRQLEGSDLSGFTFHPVIKKRIARSRWHQWDWTAPKPKRRPRGGLPENYILTRPHSVEASAEMGDLWQLRLDQITADLSMRPQTLEVILSKQAKQFLETRVGEWVVFEPVD
ncbi:MAG: hypothetical protein IH957_11930 [Chloroflexi bacterium]|nr:hypothetical protein [Chloroflexota bacterium]